MTGADKFPLLFAPVVQAAQVGAYLVECRHPGFGIGYPQLDLRIIDRRGACCRKLGDFADIDYATEFTFTEARQCKQVAELRPG